MGLLRPELLLLLLPLALLWRTWGGPLRGIGGLRLAIALLAVLAAAGPFLPLAAPGRDIVVVVDRSDSMALDAGARAEEILRLLEEERAAGDRVGLVIFGARPQVLRAPSAEARSSGLPALSEQDARGSDLAGALETALTLLPAGRTGRVLLLSDGLVDGEDPLALARRAGARGVPIDVRPLSRSWGLGARVLQLDAPAEVDPGAPLGLVGWVQADRAGEARFVLKRGETVLREGETTLEVGSNRLLFRDLAPLSGLATYTLAVHQEGDTHADDDQALAVSRVVGGRGVLVINDQGGQSALVTALTSAGVPLTALSPEQAPKDRASLEAWRVVALENVAADRLGAGLDALAAFVEDGGGLLMTGGAASFGVGGYHSSPLDPLLPVSMEQRVEQRKQGLALVIAMDRSGSMAEDVGGGRTKMDLANLGAASAIRLLGPMDHVGVLAVDESAHVVSPLGPAENAEAIAGRVLRVRSEGGGIYTRTALIAAAKLLEAAPQKNRHITLFADAADSEEQEGVPDLISRLREAGVTISVIALGSKFDSDAKFLESVAAQGGGTVAFTMRPSELPRLFAQDTLIASRASVVEEPTGTATRGELRTLGLTSSRGPTLGGYNRTWPREGSLTGLVTTDENAAPVLAWRQAGAGRTAAFTGQIGGRWGEAALAWEGMGSTLSSLTRWLGAQEAPSGWYATAAREGQDLRVTVEREPGAPLSVAPVARVRDPDGATREVALVAEGPDRWSGRVRLTGAGVTLGVVGLGPDQVLSLPPVALAGSPERVPPADPAQGERLLRRLAAASGGTVNAPVSALLQGEVLTSTGRVLTDLLLGLALALTLLEIVARRLWSGRLRLPAREAAPQAPSEPAPLSARRDAPRPDAPSGPAAPATTDTPQQNTTSDVSQALARARERAGRTLDRPN